MHPFDRNMDIALIKVILRPSNQKRRFSFLHLLILLVTDVVILVNSPFAFFLTLSPEEFNLVCFHCSSSSS